MSRSWKKKKKKEKIEAYTISLIVHSVNNHFWLCLLLDSDVFSTESILFYLVVGYINV